MKNAKNEPAPDQPTSAADNKTVSTTTLLLVAVLVLCASSAIGGFYVARQIAALPKDGQPREIVQPVDTPLAAQPKDETVDAGIPTPAEQEAMMYDQRWHVTELKNFKLLNATYPSGLIAWQVPTAQPSFGGFSANVPGQPPTDAMTYPNDPASPFLVGTVQKGTYAGFNLYVADFSCEGPCSLFARFLSDGKTVVLLTKYSDDYAPSTIEQYVKNAGKYAYKADDAFSIPELDFPKTFSLTNPKVTLSVAPEGAYRFSQFFSPQAGDSAVFSFPDHGPAFRRDNEGSFVVQAPDGTPQRYFYDLDFLSDKNGIPRVTWSDGSANTVGYGYRSYSGCGFTSYAQVVSVDEKDLAVAGTMAAGGSVYVLKDPKDPVYGSYYENVYYAPDGQKMSFEDFVASRPFFYWKDAFGRLIQFTNVNFQSQAECGKPVIYLYPTKTADISVRVEPTGGMTKSDPAYEGGWEVTAQPDGQLVQKGTGKPYPYLFWEGRSDSIWQMPQQGFVVAQADVSGFLEAKLAMLGLNVRETADFKEFWLPRFAGHPYYFVTFLGTNAMNKIAPLTVLPKPDTVIRVLMDFKGLEKPVQVQPQALSAPERHGFTVIEWGGVIH